MSKTVVSAAANRAKPLVPNKKIKKLVEDGQAAHEDQDHHASHLAQADKHAEQGSMSSGSTFAAALAGAAESTASLTLQDDGGAASGDGGTDGSGTIVAIGAAALAIGGGVIAFGGGGSKNHAPTITSAATATVAENAAATTVVYQVAATDPDGDPLTYTLGGTDAALFNISSTGAVTLKAPADFETKAAYSFTVTASDGKESATQTVAVTVTNVNEAPTLPAAATVTFAENIPTTTVIFDANGTDPDAGTTLVYTLTGTDAAAFDINASTGVVTFKASPNFEAKATYSFNVVATDAGGLAATQGVTVNITDVAEGSFTSGTTATVAENAAATTVVYDANVTGTGAGATTFTLGGADAAAFNIDAATGEVRLNTPANFEAKATYNFSVTATTVGGGAITQAVVLGVTDVNEAPVPGSTNTSSITVAEDTSATFVIDFDDPETTALPTATLVTGPAHGTLDFATSTYTPTANYNGTDSFVYRVTDAAGNATTQTVSITVTPVNDAPTVTATQAVNADAGEATNVTVVGSDVDGDTLTYTVATTDRPTHGTITGGADGKFVYTANEGFDGSDTFTVTVADPSGLTAKQVVTVTVDGTPGPAEISLDVGTPGGAAVSIDAGNGPTTLTDNAAVNTNVRIIGFSDDDVIELTGAAINDYNFGTGSGAAGEDDLQITYQNSQTGTVTLIVIQDALVNDGFVFNYETAVAAVGHNFITLG